AYRRQVRVSPVSMDDLKVVSPPQQRPDPKKQYRQSASVHCHNRAVLTDRGEKLRAKCPAPAPRSTTQLACRSRYSQTDIVGDRSPHDVKTYELLSISLYLLNAFSRIFVMGTNPMAHIIEPCDSRDVGTGM